MEKRWSQFQWAVPGTKTEISAKRIRYMCDRLIERHADRWPVAIIMGRDWLDFPENEYSCYHLGIYGTVPISFIDGRNLVVIHKKL